MADANPTGGSERTPELRGREVDINDTEVHGVPALRRKIADLEAELDRVNVIRGENAIQKQSLRSRVNELEEIRALLNTRKEELKAALEKARDRNVELVRLFQTIHSATSVGNGVSAEGALHNIREIIKGAF